MRASFGPPPCRGSASGPRWGLLQRTYIFLSKLLNCIQDSIEAAQVVQFLHEGFVRTSSMQGLCLWTPLGTFTTHLYFLSKLLNYIQDSIEVAQVVQFLHEGFVRASSMQGLCFWTPLGDVRPQIPFICPPLV